MGPEPRLPSCMLRSYLLALKLKVTSITAWCRMLRETPLYAILSGFPFVDTPGVGTFYDFFSRIWQDDSDNLSPKDRFPKMKPPRGKKKGDKTPCDSSGTTSKLLPLLEHWKFKPENPFSLVFRLYQQQFLNHSINKGLIDPDHLALAGDGTPVRTAVQQRKSGFAIARKKAVFPAAANAIILSRTATGDGTPIGNAIFSVTISICMWPPIPIAISLYFRFWNGLPGHTGHFTYKDDFTIDEDGVPICKMGLCMHKDGYEAAKHRAIYRCPKANRKRGCFCKHLCSPAKYGRTVHIFTDDNPRLFNMPPRDSKAWEKEYDGRTSVERSNKREKEDYKLEDGRHRSTKMWYCRLYGIMMLQHLDAWEMPSVEAFQKSLLGLPT